MKGATMKTGDYPQTETCDTRHGPRSGFSGRSFLRYYVLIGSLISGFFALCWVLLRSGPKPSRLAYPCQQAAMSAVTFTFGAPSLAKRRGNGSLSREYSGLEPVPRPFSNDREEHPAVMCRSWQASRRACGIRLTRTR